MPRLVVLAALLIPVPAFGDDPVDYLRDVKPLLRDRCYACHGALKQRSKLRLDTVAAMAKGGHAGPAVTAGDPDHSLLLERVTDPNEKERMPPIGKRLTEQQVAVLKAWIRQGAPAPKDEKPEQDPRDHWAFRPPVRPPVPKPSTEYSVQSTNPIDAFLAAEWRKHGLTPTPPADKATLLRRVTLDLIGLPPTRDELAAFLTDPSPGAYEKVVDRLLASSQYGERWARHWMDVWRYSDWYGRRAVPDVLNSYGQIWRWRDWIVRSLNADRGYDEMVRLMLAADEIAPDRDDDLVATGFLVRNFFRWNYNNWMRDDVEHTAKAFLGLTVNCAHCHDHKYDPISQEEYFRFRAIFEPLEIRHERWPGEPDPGPYPKYSYGAAYKPIASGMVRVFDEKPDATTTFYTGGDERNKVPARGAIPPGVPKALGGTFEVKPVSLPVVAWYPGAKPFVRQEEVKKREDAVQTATRTLATAKTGLATADRLPPFPPGKLAGLLPAIVVAGPDVSTWRVEAARDDVKTAEAALTTARADLASVTARIAADDARFFGVGDDIEALTHSAGTAEWNHNAAAKALARAQAEAAFAAARRANSPIEKLHKLEELVVATRFAAWGAEYAATVRARSYSPLSPTYTKTSSGRRAALANWVTSPANPLTARVAVNHIWGWHFGRPLVETSHNFGRSGKPPSHPELLDWLATEFVANGWKTKPLHRLIVTSQAYRMSSVAPPDHPNRTADRDIVYLWKFPPARMEAEVVRDCVLAASGELDPTAGGPEVPHEQGLTSRRRSLYFAYHGESRMAFLDLFDAANPCDAYRRTTSVMPQQALALSNSELIHRQGRVLAGKLTKTAGTEEAFVRAAFEHVLSRPPRDAELAASVKFLAGQVKLFESNKADLKPPAGGPAADPAARARENLVQALFNHTDFVTIR